MISIDFSQDLECPGSRSYDFPTKNRDPLTPVFAQNSRWGVARRNPRLSLARHYRRHPRVATPSIRKVRRAGIRLASDPCITR